MNDQLTKQLTAVIMAHGLAVASAQTPPGSGSDTNNPSKLPDVVVKGQQEQETPYKPERLQSPRYTEPLRDVPQTITVVPRAVIEQQNATTLRDVLRNVPGISFQAGEGGVPAGDNLSIRGFSARTDIFADGVRDFGGYSRDPFNTEQVEVVKGPGSSHAGRGSSGGIINMVSKSPQLDRFYAGSFGVGTEDYKRLTLDFNQPIAKSPLDGTAVRVNGMWTDSGVAGRDVINNERFGIAPSVAFGLGTPTRVTLSYFHLEQDNIPDYGIPWVPPNSGPLAAYSDKAPPVDFSNFYGLKHKDFEHTHTYIPTALIEHEFNESFSLRNLTRYGRNDRDSVITAPRFIDLDPTTNTVQYGNSVTRQNQSRDQVDTIFANQLDFTSKFDTWRLNHTVVTSLEYEHETSLNYSRTGAVIATTLFNPNSSTPYPFEIRRNGIRADAKSDSVAAAMFDTIKFGEHWQAQGGVRFEHFGTDFISLTNGRPRVPLDRDDNMVSYRAGLVYKPVKQGSIYAAYGNSFNPSAEGLTLSAAPSAANNLNIDPEESRTLEIGTKWDLLDNRLSLSLAVFRTEKTNARTDDPADPTDIVVLDGEQRVDGVEVGVAGRITEQWHVFGGYAYMVSKITESKNRDEVGKELMNTPKNTFSLWTTYDLPWDLQIGGGVEYTDSRFTSNANTREAPSYVLFNAMAGWNVSKIFTLRLNVYNLADEEYIGSVGGGHFIPGSGRAGALTASLAF
ncbi:MAG TPA: TonB-dependent siderophore receptor [Candidatus Limnocylindria bacterium]|nr:TonB-dependent siderophore receptor [Candidatus Limnocylindria bacterium]